MISMSTEEDKRVFAEIRSYCITLSQITLAPSGIFDPNSSKTTNALRDVYTHLRDTINPNTSLSANLADYIFVPLSYLLKQPILNNVQIELILNIMTLLIRHCWTAAGSIPYVLAKQLFPLITFLTGGSPKADDKTEIDSKSDELKIAGSQALNSFFTSLSKQKSANIYDFFSNVENLPALGHVVTVLLHFAEHGKTVELQLQAIKALNTLYFDLINDGEILSYILPGNVSSLTKIIAAPGMKTHYTVMVEAIELLDKLLVIVYRDEELKPKIKEIESIEEVLEGSDLDVVTIEEADLKKVHRTNSWLKATSGQVKLALQNIKKVGPQVRIEVKTAILNMCTRILKSCLFSLKSSIPVVVNILSFLSNDSRLQIDSKKLIVSDLPKNQQIVSKAISNDLNTNIDSISAILQSPNEGKILSTIAAIKFAINYSYDDFLVSRFTTLVISELSTLVKTSSKSKKVLQVDTPDLFMITNHTDHEDTSNYAVLGSIIEESVENALADLFEEIGKRDANIIQKILEESENYSICEKGVVLWVSNSLMKGSLDVQRDGKILDEFLSFEEEANDLSAPDETPESTYALLEYSKSVLDEISEAALTQESEFASSVALDTIGIAAYHMREEFRNELIDYLYPVIDGMASSNQTVRSHAWNTGNIISDTLYKSSFQSMIFENSDYLVDSVSIRLSNAMTTRATAILAVCVKVAGFKIIESFRDVLEIIFNLLDYFHGYEDLCIGFFVLFQIICDEVTKKYLSDHNTRKLEFFESSSTYAPWGLTSIEQLKNLLDKSQRDILVEPKDEGREDEVEDEKNPPDSDDEDLNESEGQNKNNEPEEIWSSPVPENVYKLLQQMVFYGERLLTHPSAKLQIQILIMFEKVVPILSTSVKNLYPITASIWPIVCKCVNNSDPKIVIPASKVMSLLLEHTGSFLSSRFTEFWSQLKSNDLLVSAKKSISLSNKVVLPGLNSKAFESFVNMLVIGINNLGRYIPDVISEEIIKSCVAVVPDVERFGVNADLAWSIKNDLYGTDVLRPIPESTVGVLSMGITTVE